MASADSGGITLLDCTLRDGGYYNDWDFSRALITEYLHAMKSSGVPIVEIGFRTSDADTFLGPAAYATDDYLRSLDLPSGITYGVMLNAKEVVAGGNPAAFIDTIFAPAAESPVDLVRIAANFGELAELCPGVERLHELGYQVGLNLMQIAARTPDEIDQFGRLASTMAVSVAYFADSFGGMQPAQVTDVVHRLKQSFDGPIGCHMHNNMSLAFSNSMAAIDAGATFVDSTVLGMGRGPGNAQTEYMAVELSRRGHAELDVVPLLPLVNGGFGELQRHYGWGANVYYFLSAAHNIHPTYIQEMTKDGRYTIDEIVTALNDLKVAGGASFNRARLESAVTESGLIDPDGTWDATGWCEGRPVLVVGPGPEGVSRRHDIEGYIRAAKPLVIALNALPPVDASLVDLFAICHPVRALIDADIINRLDQPVVMPRGIQARVAATEGGTVEFRDFGIAAGDDTMTITASSCTSPRITAFPYALAVATAGGASEIQLTGFDGFDANDPRQAEMERLIEAYVSNASAVPLVALTPTRYTIGQRSIYAPVAAAASPT
jgi:4-hydroxy 2-oxovalerate aldolase